MAKDEKCDFDCFNCKYDDCISDSTKNPIKVENNQGERKHEYYMKNREKLIKSASDRYYAKKEEQTKVVNKEPKRMPCICGERFTAMRIECNPEATKGSQTMRYSVVCIACGRAGASCESEYEAVWNWNDEMMRERRNNAE